MEALPISKKTRKNGLRIMLAVLLVGVIIGGVLLHKSLQTSPREESQVSPALPKVVDDVQKLRLAGKTDEALKYIDDGLKVPKLSNENKYQLYIQQGNIYAERADFTGAVTSFRQARLVNETYETISKLAAAYQQIGDTTKAIENYKRAIQLNPKDNPVRESQNKQFEEMIKSLGGSV